jgi:hypothetical protein
MSARGEPTHDDLIKQLLLQPRLLRDFCRGFLPGLDAFADLSRIEYIDKEHPRSGRQPRRSGDLLFKTFQRGRESAFLIHFESQHSRQEAIVERATEYAMRDAIRYRLPVVPVVLLTSLRAEAKCTGLLRWDFGRVARMEVRCPVLQFRRMNPGPHLRSRNVAALALTSLMVLNRDQQVHAIVQTLAEAVRQKLTDDDLAAAAAFVRHYLPLDESQALKVEQTFANLAQAEPELATMPKLVNPFVQIGRIHGREEGREQGRAVGLEEGRREASLRVALGLLQRKFPGLAGRVDSRVRRLDEAGLFAFCEALLFMETPADCREWLRRAGGG